VLKPSEDDVVTITEEGMKEAQSLVPGTNISEYQGILILVAHSMMMEESITQGEYNRAVEDILCISGQSGVV
jgi:hypothetical protein